MKKMSYFDLAKNENIILCNNIASLDLEPFCGNEYDEDADEYAEIYQYYIIEESFAEYLARATTEIVFYNEELDIYVWGITHYGTSWKGVYLDVKEYDEISYR